MSQQNGEIAWPNELKAFLHHTVRELKFNWSQVSESLSQFVENHPHYNCNVIGVISPEICRQQVYNKIRHLNCFLLVL